MKRTFAVMTVLALVLASFGVLSVNAAEQGTESAVLAQQNQPGWLGVSVGDAPNGGAVIGDVVAGSPAEDAGLQSGDVINAVNGTDITSAQDLVDAIGGMASGDTVTLNVTSGDQTSDVTVTLGERPQDFGSGQPVRPNQPNQPNQPNFQNPPMFQGMLSFLGLNLTATEQGIQVDSIDQSSPFADSGLQEGDVITAINGNDVTDYSFMGDLMSSLMSGDNQISLTVLRNGQETTVDVQIDLSSLQSALPFADAGAAQPPTQLGVRYQVVTPDVAQEQNLTVQEGALITQVFDNTPAADAGLQEGDVVTAVDGDSVDEEHTLSDRLYAYEEGDTVTLSVLRNGETQDISVTLGPRNTEQGYGFQFGPGMMGPGMMGPDFFDNHPWMMPGPNSNGQWFFYGPNQQGQPDQMAPTVPQTPA